ncbi:MAG: hydrogenase maturation nickel metallochaperone HypA [Myxococcales bacterium]
MHELAIVQQVIEIASEASGGRHIRRVVLEIGKLSAVLPDAVRFCFDLAAEGTPVEGATLEIVELPGTARCRACGATVELSRPFGRCACDCTDLEWLSGEELKVRELEVV